MEHWEDAARKNIGLLLFGDVGTGKSFLAGCIANALLEQNMPVLMTNFPTILNRMTGLFGSDRADFLANLNAYDLLILDDLGAERGTEYALEQVFAVIDARYYPRNWYDREYRSFMKDLIKAHPEIPSLTPHELRHTRATLWSAQGVPQHLIADLLGHCDTRMLERVYNHTTTDTLRQALEAVQTKEGERA